MGYKVFYCVKFYLIQCNLYAVWVVVHTGLKHILKVYW